MTEENSSSEGKQQKPADPWAEVGQQFKVLGESLTAAFNATWQSEETQQLVQKMQSGLNEAAGQINEAVKKATESEEGKKMQAEFGKATKTAQTQGTEMFEQVRPHIVEAFRSIRQEIDRAINRMEETPAKPATKTPPTDETGLGQEPVGE